MPGEEGTGLHAFDDLDPVSTVSALSALSVMPEPEEVPGPLGLPPPGHRSSARGSTPPPAPRSPGNGANAARRSAPPPPPQARGGKSMAPPPRPGANASGRSVPPVPALIPQAELASRTEMHDEPEAEFDEDTKVVPNAFTHDPDFAPTAAFARPGGDSSDASEEPVSEANQAAAAGDGASVETGVAGASIDDGELLELSATTVATKIDMDWDEDEVETKLRDEGSASAEEEQVGAPMAAPLVAGRPSPFPPPQPAGGTPFTGNPSPFFARSGFSPQPSNDASWEDEDEAMTKIMAPGSISLPSVPGSVDDDRRMAGARGSLAEVAERFFATLSRLTSGEHGERSAASNRLLVAGAVVTLVVFAIVARAMIGGRQLATVTLITKPTDALVSIDGRPLTGQTSPFTVQGLKPGIEHTIEVTRDGYVAATHNFQIAAGEVKPLPTVELAATRVDTGFALTSLPAGAAVYVDGRRLDQPTPVRIGDLASGLHVVRLEYGSAYQPWETQVALAAGQVIELPTARLVPAAPGQAAFVGHKQPESDSTLATSTHSSSDSASGHHHTQPKHVASTMPAVLARPSMPMAAPSRAPAPMPASPMVATPTVASAGGGSQGSLRLNSRPWSQVFVDGRMIGNTPQLNLPLPAGHHKIKLVNPQLGMSKGFAVDIRAGKVQTKVVDLE